MRISGDKDVSEDIKDLYKRYVFERFDEALIIEIPYNFKVEINGKKGKNVKEK